MNKKKNVAIITGASSGLGKEFVNLILNDDEIDEIWAIARDEKKLQALLEEGGKKIKPFSIDLSIIDEIKKFEEEIKKQDIVIKILINNAGFAKFCSYDDLSIDESINMVDLNVSGVVAMGLVCIPYMERGSHILNISSQASFQPLPYQNIYSSTKAFVRNYSRALNVELKDRGISVTAVCPGWMKTALFDRAAIGAEKATNNFSGMVTPDKVAKKALKDAKKNKDISVYGIYVKFCHLMAKLLPQKMMMKVWLMQQKIG
ncbi:SDR family NAD(P)-dependent oxidoreductase [Acetivibrio mesophilus]|uniref:SDR family NAD(P)-dependent oxidoreductase n=1 Tax=Acetivibrio mesophilus TaxID=2487273 RepID=A0A4Q0I4L6_9FIRM|nr:SDR family NAD(P)-dependent oxidoreductase [Acetivibrio mesophilus]ODM24831.1 short-chain dehydrogenase [Clostridium sp. Bc-iso-3]RXE58665.1 SDR family NAD(P)-dependent oxidoreductase [Acetivibrio mesophilus]